MKLSTQPMSRTINTVRDRKSTRLNSSHTVISYAVFCLKKKKKKEPHEIEEINDVKNQNEKSRYESGRSHILMCLSHRPRRCSRSEMCMTVNLVYHGATQ